MLYSEQKKTIASTRAQPNGNFPSNQKRRKGNVKFFARGSSDYHFNFSEYVLGYSSRIQN